MAPYIGVLQKSYRGLERLRLSSRLAYRQSHRSPIITMDIHDYIFFSEEAGVGNTD